jgi:hypothetical protein
LNLRAAISKIAEISLTPLPPDINFITNMSKNVCKTKKLESFETSFCYIFLFKSNPL